MSKDRRRANGEGTTYQRSDGRWVAAWTETDATGTTKRRSKYAATEREAKAALKAALRRVEDGLPGVDATTPLTVYAERWASTTLAAADVKESTRDLYRSALRLWVLPLLGRMPLSRLRASDVEGLVVRLELEGKGPAARRTAYTVLRRVLDAAVRDELLARNPAASVPRPRVDSAAGASRFLDREQVGALLAASRGGRLEPLVVLLAPPAFVSARRWRCAGKTSTSTAARCASREHSDGSTWRRREPHRSRLGPAERSRCPHRQ